MRRLLKTLPRLSIGKPIWRFLNAKLKRQLIREFKESILRDREFQEMLKAVIESVDLESELFGEGAVKLQQRMEVIEHTAKVANKAPKGLWMEFGVHQGTSLNLLAEATTKTVYGFDSFQGLPEEWVLSSSSRAEKGHFSVADLPSVGINVELVVGWFEDTVPDFVKANTDPVQFVHIDCDLYSSTKFVLDHLNFQSGSIILFDEYFNYPNWRDGEYKAFQEFLSEKGFRAECLCYGASAWNAAFRLQKE